MFNSELWRTIILTSLCEFSVIIIVAVVLIVFYPALTLYIILGAIGVVALYVWMKYRIYKPIVNRPSTEIQDELIGKIGLAITDLNPRGQVKMRNEVWSARTASGFIPYGTKIEVIEMEGIQLVVQPIPKLN
ncbi:MAG TPA: NfeD family protein [Candidatus Deferrimicrobium sp.]|nr:NfeD family protein [Candidatus Deferrimicrobium sp.]